MSCAISFHNIALFRPLIIVRFWVQWRITIDPFRTDHMSKKFRISHSQSIKLPNKCILCGAHPQTEYKIHGSTLSGFSFWIYFSRISYRKMNIPIPVCLKHYFVIMIMRILLFVSCTAMIFFGIPILFSFFDPSFFSDIPAIYFIIFIISLAIFILSLKLQPIKLKDIGQHFFTLFIRNDEYANDFSLINNILSKSDSPEE